MNEKMKVDLKKAIETIKQVNRTLDTLYVMHSNMTKQAA